VASSEDSAGHLDFTGGTRRGAGSSQAGVEEELGHGNH
jgi:hypothetical protein